MRQVCNMHTLLLLSMGEKRFWFGLVWFGYFGFWEGWEWWRFCLWKLKNETERNGGWKRFSKWNWKWKVSGKKSLKAITNKGRGNHASLLYSQFHMPFSYLPLSSLRAPVFSLSLSLSLSLSYFLNSMEFIFIN